MHIAHVIQLALLAVAILLLLGGWWSVARARTPPPANLGIALVVLAIAILIADAIWFAFVSATSSSEAPYASEPRSFNRRPGDRYHSN